MHPDASPDYDNYGKFYLNSKHLEKELNRDW